MKTLSILRHLAVLMAAVGLCAPQLALANAPEGIPQALVMDVQLHEGGLLLGQVVTPDNEPVAGVEVKLTSEGAPVAAAKTGAGGRFAFRGLQGSKVYQVTTNSALETCQVWDKHLAPPSAQPGVLIVSGSRTVRGQCGGYQCGGGQCGGSRCGGSQCGGGTGGCGVLRLLANPLVMAAVVATAVAVPVALHNSRGPRSP